MPTLWEMRLFVCAGPEGLFPNRHSDLTAAQSAASHNAVRVFVPDYFSKLGKHLIHVNAAMGNWVLHIREETRVLRLVTRDWGDQWMALLIAVQPLAKAYKLGPMTLSVNLRNTSSLT